MIKHQENFCPDLYDYLYSQTLKAYKPVKSKERNKILFLAKVIEVFSNLEAIEYDLEIGAISITLEINLKFYTFWSVEMPRIENKTQFVKYLSSQLKNIFLKT